MLLFLLLLLLLHAAVAWNAARDADTDAEALDGQRQLATGNNWQTIAAYFLRIPKFKSTSLRRRRGDSATCHIATAVAAETATATTTMATAGKLDKPPAMEEVTATKF
ncbi:hypothetical protein ACLKA6_003209 [Drosophila palustris]